LQNLFDDIDDIEDEPKEKYESKEKLKLESV